ncbi:hypothetical protein AQUCO_07800006v1 [Aquilegia coerulea]|uniref:F-box domain-containing protein n=1 Tax=Aquilegia coerulea TaxID=218851 RepID=A0A2G5C7U3_AQUCA|nr:hypothetical protein AQUCO_07800006v1 [Aquilegia coerulea]
MRKKARTMRTTNNVKRSWSDLPSELLLIIFNRLDIKDVFWLVSFVCRSWQLACWEVLFWEVDLLNLRKLESLCNSNIVEDEFGQLGFALKKVIDSIFKHNVDILERTHRQSYQLILPSIQLSDNGLFYIAERTPNLQFISLNMSRITGKGFSRVILNWRELREMTMEPPSDSEYTHVIQEIGVNCRKLRSLSIVSETDQFFFDEHKCHVIAINLPNLEKITLANGYIYKIGLQTILINCKQLRSLMVGPCMRALDDVKITRSRRALAVNPPRFIPKPIALWLRPADSFGFIKGKRSRRQLATKVIDFIWATTGDKFGQSGTIRKYIDV